MDEFAILSNNEAYVIAFLIFEMWAQDTFADFYQ